jgi:phosphocarrier protein HPr
MYSRTVIIASRTGLHARPAALFAQAASRFQSAVAVSREGRRVDGKSVLSLMLLEANRGVQITIEAEGADEMAAVDHLAQLMLQDPDE